MWEEFQVNGETIRVDEADMEPIRQAVLQLLASKEDELCRFLREDLDSSILIFGSQGLRFGFWVLTEREEGLALVRIPPRAEVNYIFGAKLEFDGEHWTATQFIEERMMMWKR